MRWRRRQGPPALGVGANCLSPRFAPEAGSGDLWHNAGVSTRRIRDHDEGRWEAGGGADRGDHQTPCEDELRHGPGAERRHGDGGHGGLKSLRHVRQHLLRGGVGGQSQLEISAALPRSRSAARSPLPALGCHLPPHARTGHRRHAALGRNRPEPYGRPDRSNGATVGSGRNTVKNMDPAPSTTPAAGKIAAETSPLPAFGAIFMGAPAPEDMRTASTIPPLT